MFGQESGGNNLFDTKTKQKQLTPRAEFNVFRGTELELVIDSITGIVMTPLCLYLKGAFEWKCVYRFGELIPRNRQRHCLVKEMVTSRIFMTISKYDYRITFPSRLLNQTNITEEVKCEYLVSCQHNLSALLSRALLLLDLLDIPVYSPMDGKVISPGR